MDRTRPLAGPLVVAGVILLEDIQNLADSKVFEKEERKTF